MRLSLGDLAVLQRINFADSNYYFAQSEFYNNDGNPDKRDVRKLDSLYQETKKIISHKKNLSKIYLLLDQYKAVAVKICPTKNLEEKISAISFSGIETTQRSELIRKLCELHEFNNELLKSFSVRRQLKCHSVEELNPLKCILEKDSATTHTFKISMPGYTSCYLNNLNCDTVYLDGKLQLGLVKPIADNSLFNIKLFNLQKGYYQVNGIFYYDLGFKYKELPFSYTFTKK
ncbi:MAG: hypothetical protein IAF38_19220 [Bacteroidia bacterium]|nr:hypothetical protein [Bacteroidia bacterium]